MATVTEKAIEVAADAAEEVAEESTQVAEAMREWNGRDVGLGITFGLGAGIAIGAFGSFFVLSKKLKTKYEQIADEEIANMKAHYDAKLRALENREEKATLESVKKDIDVRTEEGDEGGGHTPYHTMYAPGGSEPEKAPDPTVVNIFNNNNDDPEVEMTDGWDIEAELAFRAANPGEPYVVHRNEHEEGPEGPEEYEKFTLTYFEGDDVLCKEDDSIIEDQDGVVGLVNLSRFGHGSDDPNIVYIRNDKLKVDLEVVHSDGKYASEVAGFKDDELQHSSMRRRSPRRSDIDSEH